ncbi:hypothetical protein OG765_01885 [Streptomyces sp. NBC_00555]|uniref:hypothetical protein n=1 Tax=Streptomyces sp. NBC_00555 TaxID=2903662 RepID=UPI002255B22A|nr:hypothetical protein [Streptomyces sp. NBC_00555]MCX5009740.1 hypothetical protein [Streptomyces sp. NBC_00555]
MIDRETVGMTEDVPTTARVQDVLNRATRVVIVEESPDKVDSTDLTRLVVTGDEIADLARHLAIMDGGTGDRCRCNGWPTIMVHGPDGELTACWTLHHQTGLRGIGNCDADLRDGPALTEWLAQRGLTRSQDVQEMLAEEEAEAEQRRMRWIQAAPAGLADVAADVSQPPGRDDEAWSRQLDDARDRLAARIRQHYPDAIERIRALLAWAGICSRESTGGWKWYDMAVMRQLHDESPDLVLAALAAHPPSPAQLDGASELFCTVEWTKAHDRHLPEPQRSMLIGHIQADGTDTMRRRLSWGYYGAERTA